MPIEAAPLFIQFVFSLLAYALVAKWYVAPRLAGKPLHEALPPLLLPHFVRPISLWLLVPGVVVLPSIPPSFAKGTAYGDLVVAVLALVAVLLVRSGHRAGALAAWIFDVAGLLDALRNCLVGIHTKAPAHMGAAVFVVGYAVPLLLVSHVLVAKVLLEHRRVRQASAP